MTNEFEIHSSLNLFLSSFSIKYRNECAILMPPETIPTESWFKINVQHKYKKKILLKFTLFAIFDNPFQFVVIVQMIHKFNDHLNSTPNLLKSSSSLDRDAVYTFHRCQLSERSTIQIQSNVWIAHISMAWACDEVIIVQAAVKWSRHFVIRRYENQIDLIFSGKNSPINVSFDFFVYSYAKLWFL